MNKNKKVDKNEKFKIVLKRIINIFCYVCTGITLLFLIIYGCFGCSNNNDQAKANVNIDENQFVLRNNAPYKFDSNGSTGFHINEAGYLTDISNIYRSEHETYVVSLGSSACIVVRDSNDSTITLDEQWTVIIDIDYPVQVGNKIRFETPNWTREFQIVDGGQSLVWYRTVNYSPEDYFYDSIFLPLNMPYNAPNFNEFRDDLSFYFRSYEYLDYQLSYSWSPLAYVNSTVLDIAFNGVNPNSDIVTYNKTTNYVYGTSFYLIRDAIFSVNGVLYTDLLMHTQEITNGTFNCYRYDYSDFDSVTVAGGTTYFPDFVYCYNRSSEATLVIWTQPYEDIDNTYHVYQFERGFRSASFQKFRIFGYHLTTGGINGTVNGDVLGVNGYISSGSFDNGEITDAISGVFELMTMSFTGMASFFNISIGAGLTLGAFILVPLTLTIIFALIKLFKR